MVSFKWRSVGREGGGGGGGTTCRSAIDGRCSLPSASLF